MTISWERPTGWDAPGVPPKGGDSRRILDFIDRLAQAKPVEMIYKSAGTSINSAGTGTTYTNDPHLSFEVGAGEVCRITLEALIDGGTTGDFKERFLLPSGTIYCAYYEFSTTNLVALVDGSAEITGLQTTGAGARLPVRVSGTLIVGTTGGIVNWQWAQNAADAVNTTVAVGSVLEVVRLA